MAITSLAHCCPKVAFRLVTPVSSVARDEKYLFHDATGEIIVEIDDDKWGGVTASPKDALELSGEIDRDINKVKVDVYLARKVSGAAPKQGFQEN